MEKLTFILQGYSPLNTFSLSIECSHIMQALEQSLFIPHNSFIFLLGVFAFERMLSNFHVLDVFVEACEGEYQRLLKMFPANAENGGIHHAAHFFKNSDLDLHSFAAQRMLSNNILFIGFVAQSMLELSNCNWFLTAINI